MSQLDREIAALRREVTAVDMQRAATTPEGPLAAAISRGAAPVIRVFVQREIAHAVDNAERQAAKVLSVITKELA
jgi:hypothetical protein